MATNNTITRRKYERDFCYMANEFLKDSRLSWKAKGIIAYVQMLPDDWVLNMRDLTNRATDGRDSLYSGIKELEKYGYCAKVMQRNPDGTIAGYAYEICDKSVFQPFTENPVTDAPQPENPDTVKPDTDKLGTENPTLINTNLTKDLNTLNTNPSNTPQNTFASLFPDETKVEEPKEKKTLFRNSDVYKMVKFENGVGVDYSEFESKFATPEFEKVDLVYYFHSVSDWSDQKNMKRTKNGWLATVRNFIRGDVEKKKLHLKPEYKAPTQRLNVAGAIEYLKDDY
jgi:hypothetical protein